MTKKKKEQKGMKIGFFQQIIVAVLVFALLSGLYSVLSGSSKKVEDVSISQVAQMVTAGTVKSITIKGDTLEIVASDDTLKEAKKESESSLSETLSNYGVTSEALANAGIIVKDQSGIGYWLITLLPIIIPIIFMIFFFWIMFAQMRGMQGGVKNAFSFGQSKARMQDPEDKDKRVTFADVAGNHEAKQELIEVVDFLKNPKKYIDIGAKIPKGVLLTGGPGTGKTLLARATAGEAGVPFFHLSGSEFVEMFVGVGASRVRDLFEVAKRAAPAIIFIDEIDAVGRSRGVGMGGGNDEREQTLNQILVEMDGFEPTEKVVVMAATNRADVLDTALLRPGRFDRRVYLDVPDRKDREAILRIHAKEKPFEESVDLSIIAERTPGFSGADLESLMNEAAILAARHDRKTITQQDLRASVEKVMMGPERKSHLHTPKDREIVAYHEAGHAIVGSALEFADPVHKISIVARGHAGGYTMSLPLEERKLPSRNELLDDLAVMFGGRAAEKLIFNEITTGAENDITVATRTARDMVTRWGMSDELGPIAYTGKGRGMWGEPAASGDDHSSATGQKIDQEVSLIIKTAMGRAQETLAKYRDALDAVAKKLLEVETLEQDAYNELIKPFGLIGKTKSA